MNNYYIWKISMFGLRNCDFECEFLINWTCELQSEIMRFDIDECWLKTGSLGVFLRKPQVHLDVYIVMVMWYLCSEEIKGRRGTIRLGGNSCIDLWFIWLSVRKILIGSQELFMK